jgi:hypothetical protein
MGKDNQPDFTEAKLPGTRWQVFKDIFTQRFGALVKINLLMLLFALPLVAWIVLNGMLTGQMLGAYLPHTANYGTGYLAVSDLALQHDLAVFQNNIMYVLIMIPLILIAGMGFGGGFHVLKLLVWGEGIMVSRDFFRGLKRNAAQFLLGALLVAVLLAAVILNLSLMPITDTAAWLKIVTNASVILLLVLGLFFVMYYVTQAETYKMSFWALIKNSFIFAIGMLLQNFFFMLISLVPFILYIFFGSGILATIFIVIFGLFGFSYTALIWTIYTQYVFDKYINDKVEGAIKDRGVWRKKQDEAELNAKRLKAANVRLVSSIDEGRTFTPLSENFSRADLRRMAAEKRAVKDEIDAELAEAEIRRAEIMNEDWSGDGDGEEES